MTFLSCLQGTSLPFTFFSLSSCSVLKFHRLLVYVLCLACLACKHLLQHSELWDQISPLEIPQSRVLPELRYQINVFSFDLRFYLSVMANIETSICIYEFIATSCKRVELYDLSLLMKANPLHEFSYKLN